MLNRAMIYKVEGTVTFDTTDQFGLSCSEEQKIPTFYLDALVQEIMNVEQAKQIAEKIVCPFELQYESLRVNLIITPLTLGFDPISDTKQ